MGRSEHSDEAKCDKVDEADAVVTDDASLALVASDAGSADNMAANVPMDDDGGMETLRARGRINDK